MHTHVKVAAVLFVVIGALAVLGALFSSVLFGLLATAAGTSDDEGAALGAAMLGLTGAALAGVLLAYAIPSFICGWGLLKSRRWARILAIVLGALALIQFPVGTAFGIYVLWVFFNRRTEAVFGDA